MMCFCYYLCSCVCVGSFCGFCPGCFFMSGIMSLCDRTEVQKAYQIKSTDFCTEFCMQLSYNAIPLFIVGWYPCRVMSLAQVTDIRANKQNTYYIGITNPYPSHMIICIYLQSYFVSILLYILCTIVIRD